jgi:predicted transcriptional regulator
MDQCRDTKASQLFTSALLYRKGEALLLHGEIRPLTHLPARATSATSQVQKDAVGRPFAVSGQTPK